MARRRLTRCLYWLAFLPLVLRFSVCFVLLFCFSFFSYTSPPPLPHPLICLPPPYASRREPSASVAEPPCHVTASVRHHGRAASTKAAVFALPKSAFASAAEATRKDSASLFFRFQIENRRKRTFRLSFTGTNSAGWAAPLFLAGPYATAITSFCFSAARHRSQACLYSSYAGFLGPLLLSFAAHLTFRSSTFFASYASPHSKVMRAEGIDWKRWVLCTDNGDYDAPTQMAAMAVSSRLLCLLFFLFFLLCFAKP